MNCSVERHSWDPSLYIYVLLCKGEDEHHCKADVNTEYVLRKFCTSKMKIEETLYHSV